MQTVQTKNGYAMTAAACLWLGLFPLMHGGSYAHITYDKWIFMMILTGVTFVCFLLDRIHSLNMSRKSSASAVKNRSGIRPGIMYPFTLFSILLLWTVLSCLLSSCGPDIWWIGESARYEGLLTKLLYFSVFILFFFSRIHMKPVLFSAAAGVFLFFTIVLLQRAPGNPFSLYPSGRNYNNSIVFQGTIGNVDMDTGYLLLMAGLFLYGFISSLSAVLTPGKARLFRLKQHMPETVKLRASAKAVGRILLPAVLLLALLIDIYLIITMGVQFGFIGLAVLSLFTFLRFLPRKWRLPVLIFLIVLALLIVWFWPRHGGGIWELHEIVHGRGRLSFGSNRVAVWLYSLRLARENLLFGGGSGTFRVRFNQFLSDHGLTIPNEQDGVALPDYFDNPHNEYVSQLTDHGLPAALCFMALLFAAVFRRREAWFPCLAPCSAAVLCYAVQAFFSFSVCLVAPMFWVVLGISFTSSGR